MSKLGGILIATSLTIAAISAFVQTDRHMMDEHGKGMGDDHRGMMSDNGHHRGMTDDDDHDSDRHGQGMMEDGHDMNEDDQ